MELTWAVTKRYMPDTHRVGVSRIFSLRSTSWSGFKNKRNLLSIKAIVSTKVNSESILTRAFCLQDRYESSFLLVAGDLRKPIPINDIPEFLDTLFPSFPHQISSYNVLEVMELFGRHGSKSKELYWSDVRKGLREHKPTTGNLGSLRIRSALNPKSWVVECRKVVARALAVYYFISVPIRIAFLPWGSMVHVEALGIDLTTDSLCVLNLVVLMNTAYMNSRATWVTKRSKIVHKIHIGFFIAALPFDW